MLDAVLALTVLIIGIVIIASSFISRPQPSQVDVLTTDLLKFMSEKKIKDLNNPYSGIGGELWEQGLITDGENSIIQQAGQFYVTGRLDIADKFVQNATADLIPAQYKFELLIDGVRVYPQVPDTDFYSSRDIAQVLLKSQGLTFGVINKTTSRVFGPYKVELFVWMAGDKTITTLTTYTMCQRAETEAACDFLDIFPGPGYARECCCEHSLCCGYAPCV